jgi:hypothetical protein
LAARAVSVEIVLGIGRSFRQNEKSARFFAAFPDLTVFVPLQEEHMAEQDEVYDLQDELETIDGWVPRLAKHFEPPPDSNEQAVIDRVAEAADPAALPVLRRALQAAIEYRRFWQANDALRKRRGMAVIVLAAGPMEAKLKAAIERCTPAGEPVSYEGPAPLVRGPSLFTMVLFVLNTLAAVGFGYLLILDYHKRAEWSYAVFRHDLALWGLPLAEEEKSLTGWDATKPPQRIDSEQLQKQFKMRKGTVGTQDKFVPVHEVVGQRIKPSQLTPEALKDLFAGVPGGQVTTLEEEVDRVEKELFAKAEAAASEALQAAKNDAGKRGLLEFFLLPMTTSGWQIDAVDKEIKEAKAADLDRLVVDAGQRRVLVDLLRLLEEHRPATPFEPTEEEKKGVADAVTRVWPDVLAAKRDFAIAEVMAARRAILDILAGSRKALLDASADPAKVKLSQIQDLVRERFKVLTDRVPADLPRQDFPKYVFKDMKGGGGVVLGEIVVQQPPGPSLQAREAQLERESYTKRQNIAYLLYAISQLRKPANPAEPIFAKGAERVQTVVGLFEYTVAADAVAQALEMATHRVLDAIAIDRDGYAIKPGAKLEEVHGFVGRHQALVQRIVHLLGEVKDQQARLIRLKADETRNQEQLDKRKQHYDDVVAKLLKNRQETALHVAEMRKLEQQLFQAQLDLADAARTNEQLERDIRTTERAVRRRRP